MFKKTKQRRPLGGQQNIGQHEHREEVKAMRMHPRKRIADYNLYHSIGKGSFGEVVLAQRDGDPEGIFLACKVIRLNE